jgi:hypothetical protein
VDPGIINMASCSEILVDGTLKNWRLTKKRWDDLACGKLRLRRSRLYCESLKDAFKLLGDPEASPKTASLDQYLRHVEISEQVKEQILNETMRSRWADDSFFFRQKKAQALDLFWSEVISGSVQDGTAGIMPIFAFGDAKIRGSYGSSTAPSSGLVISLQRIAGVVNVVFVDEFRTSACCATCGFLLHSVQTANASKRQDTRVKHRLAALAARGEKEKDVVTNSPPPSWDMRGLKLCRNQQCLDNHSSFRDRDVNAALNMLKIFGCLDAGIPVPETLTRGYNFTSDDRAWVKRNYYKLPQNLDTTSFKKSHGDGGQEIAANRLYEREHNYKVSGWTAPLGGSHARPRPLFPTVSTRGAKYRTLNWPLNQYQQVEEQRETASRQDSSLRAVGEPTRSNQPLTAAPSPFGQQNQPVGQIPGSR